MVRQEVQHLRLVLNAATAVHGQCGHGAADAQVQGGVAAGRQQDEAGSKVLREALVDKLVGGASNTAQGARGGQGTDG
jgi:hypothetical protein